MPRRSTRCYDGRDQRAQRADTNLPTAKTTPKIQPKTAGNDAVPKNQEEQTTPSDTKTATEDASNPPAETVEQPEDASNPQGEGADSVFQALDEAVLAREEGRL